MACNDLFENSTLYDMMCKITVEPEMSIRPKLIAC